MKLRPEVQRFAELMETKLRENDHKSHWSERTDGYLRRRLRMELRELMAAMDQLRRLDVKFWKQEATEPAAFKAARIAVTRETVDVANFAMMIADNSGGMEP